MTEQLVEQEVWKDVIGYEGLYQVSNQGRVKSLDRVIHKSDGKSQRFKEKLMTLTYQKTGYVKVCLSKQDKGVSFSVHRIVLCAFNPNMDNFFQVNHIDGNKSNNTLSNLEWVTPSENVQHAYRTGLHKPNPFRHRKRIYQFMINGALITSYNSIIEASKNTGLNYALIRQCAYNKPFYHTAGGYRWSFNSTLDDDLEYRYKRKIYQFDMNNKLVAVHESMKEASNNNQKDAGNIKGAIHGRQKTAKGFKWSYEPVIDNNFSGLKHKVYQFDLQNNLIAEHESISEAARVTNIQRSNIRKVANGKYNATGGFKWSYESYLLN